MRALTDKMASPRRIVLLALVLIATVIIGLTLGTGNSRNARSADTNATAVPFTAPTQQSDNAGNFTVGAFSLDLTGEWQQSDELTVGIWSDALESRDTEAVIYATEPMADTTVNQGAVIATDLLGLIAPGYVTSASISATGVASACEGRRDAWEDAAGRSGYVWVVHCEEQTAILVAVDVTDQELRDIDQALVLTEDE